MKLSNEHVGQPIPEGQVMADKSTVERIATKQRQMFCKESSIGVYQDEGVWKIQHLGCKNKRANGSSRCNDTINHNVTD
jgi:hypothetical protein